MEYWNDDELISLYKFFEQEKKYIEELNVNGEISEDELLEKKKLFLCAQFSSKAYTEEQIKNPRCYPQYDVDEVAETYMYIDTINKRLSRSSDGSIISRKMPVYSAVTFARRAIDDISIAGVEDNIEERVLVSVSNAIQTVYDISLNDVDFVDSKDKLINVPEVLNRYPAVLITLSDEATQAVFKNKVERNEYYQYSVKGKSGAIGNILLTTLCCADVTYQMDIEKQFSTYDLAVVEAISTLYYYAEKEGKLNDGKILLDIQSIDKMIKYDTKTRMSAETKNNLNQSEIYKSIIKLCNNHVTINDDSGIYEGNLLEAEFMTINESTGRGDALRTCLCLNACPILFEFARNNGRNFYQKIKMDDLSIKMKRKTALTVAVQRYVMQRVKEIFGSYLIDDNHKNVKFKQTNTIRFDSLMKAVYPEGLGRFESKASAIRNLQEATKRVLDAMNKKGYFSGIKENTDTAEGNISWIITR